MIGIQLAAVAASVVVGRVALRHDHPVELAMAVYLLACGLLLEALQQ